MQISASASPAAYPPGVSMPASITRAPPGSVRSVTRSASAFVAMRSAISNARPFRSSPPLSPPPSQDLPLPELRHVARVTLVAAGDVAVRDCEPVTRSQIAEQHRDVRRAVGADVAKRRRALDRAEGHDEIGRAHV